MKKWIALLSAFLLTLSCATAESPDAGQTALLSLDANPSTGYAWTGLVLSGDAVQLDSAEGTYIPDEQTDTMTGAGGQTQYAVTAVKPGRSIITSIIAAAGRRRRWSRGSIWLSWIRS